MARESEFERRSRLAFEAIAAREVGEPELRAEPRRALPIWLDLMREQGISTPEALLESSRGYSAGRSRQAFEDILERRKQEILAAAAQTGPALERKGRLEKRRTERRARRDTGETGLGAILKLFGLQGEAERGT